MKYDPSLPGHTWYQMLRSHLGTAFFIAIFIAGFAIGLFSEPHFRFAARIACPPPATFSYDEYYDGESTTLSGYCTAPGGQPQEITLGLLGLIFLIYILAFFTPLAAAGTLIRLIRASEKPPA
jgi:hypothetical protein